MRTTLARIWVFSWILVWSIGFGAYVAEGGSFSFHEPAVFKVDGQRFDLNSDAALWELAKRAEALLAQEEVGKKDRRGLKEIVRLKELYGKEGSMFRRFSIRRRILELGSAIANNHRPAIPAYVGLPDLPFRFMDSLSNPVGRGTRPASNLMACGGGDLSKADPLPSSYWRRPESVAEADLYAGFGREELPDVGVRMWLYRGPKKSGGNPGCELVSGSGRIKVKFAETHSEPFASRIFHALGYYVEATDYVRRLKVRYDRRLFTEFNMLPEIKMKIGMFFLPIHTFHFERTYDPFEFIESAVFKDGTVRTGRELKEMLLRDGRRVTVENFRPEIEAEIDHLVTVEANVQVEGENGKSIGPWDFGGLGREHLRELRGAGVLAAWLGWWDARFDNTRLRLVETGSGVELRHFFSDLGAGLGRSAGTYRHSSEKPNEFEWVFTRGGASKGDWRFEIINYEPIEDAPAFEETTIDDARWMARLIGQLSEEQIVTGLIASGFESAEVRIYAEKLISRRDRLIRDTGLGEEIPLLRADGIDRGISYDPRYEGAVKVRTKGGQQVIAVMGESILENGQVRRAR